MSEKHGGPAFPTFQTVQAWNDDKGKYRERIEPMGGMTLRDYFAAKAIEGTADGQGLPPTYIENYARTAYAIADAMLAEREKGGA